MGDVGPAPRQAFRRMGMTMAQALRPADVSTVQEDGDEYLDYLRKKGRRRIHRRLCRKSAEGKPEAVRVPSVGGDRWRSGPCHWRSDGGEFFLDTGAAYFFIDGEYARAIKRTRCGDLGDVSVEAGSAADTGRKRMLAGPISPGTRPTAGQGSADGSMYKAMWRSPGWNICGADPVGGTRKPPSMISWAYLPAKPLRALARPLIGRDRSFGRPYRDVRAGRNGGGQGALRPSIRHRLGLGDRSRPFIRMHDEIIAGPHTGFSTMILALAWPGAGDPRNLPWFTQGCRRRGPKAANRKAGGAGSTLDTAIP